VACHFASLLLVMVALLPAQLDVQPPQGRVVQASELVGNVASGQGVNEVGLRIEGDVDLRPVSTVARPFRCRECTFSGTIDASDVVFQGIIDLSGSILEGNLLLTGARLEAPFVLDATRDDRSSEIRGRTDLRLTKFSDFASLDRARMLGPVDLTSTQFASSVSFAEAEFGSEAVFDRVQFGSSTSFADASTQGLRLTRATFAGPAIFRQHRFHHNADFTGATFQHTADFTLAEFDGEALFDSVTFDRGASFRLVVASYASLRSVQAGGPLVLDGAVFERGASLAGLTALDTLSLRSLRTITDDGLELDQLAASTLLLDVPTIDYVRGIAVQEQVLSLLEESAESAGNLPLANDARFRRMAIQASRRGPIYRLFDGIVFRGIAGYLVRPLHPLRVSVILLLFGAIVRALPTWWADRQVNFRVFLRGLYASSRQGFARRSGIDWQAEEVPTARTVAMGSEFLAHKVLIVISCLAWAIPILQ
jgi:uncharacterized protein YjbI with pentapeptide repeats